jgi:hypothetical protein
MYAFHFSSMHATCPGWPILLDLIILIICLAQSSISYETSSLCSFLQLPITTSLGTNIFLRTMSSYTLNLYPFRIVRDVSHSYKSAGKIEDNLSFYTDFISMRHPTPLSFPLVLKYIKIPVLGIR